MAPEQKQNAEKPTEDTQQEGFNPSELGQQSIYEGPTDMMRRMLRGNEAEGDPDTRDVAGATDFKDIDEAREDQDTVPRDKNA